MEAELFLNMYNQIVITKGWNRCGTSSYKIWNPFH